MVDVLDAGVDQAIDLDVGLGVGGGVLGQRGQDGEREGRLLLGVSGGCNSSQSFRDCSVCNNYMCTKLSISFQRPTVENT
jgi:hypothetical protein